MFEKYLQPLLRTYFTRVSLNNKFRFGYKNRTFVRQSKSNIESSLTITKINLLTQTYLKNINNDFS